MSFFSDIEFVHKYFFWLLLLLPLMVVSYVWRYKKSSGEMYLSTLSFFAGLKKSAKEYLRHGLFVSRLIALAAIITALARPQSSTSWQNVTTEGIDIILSMDVSGSMLAEDLKPNRLEASKEVAMDFISGRPDDRMGLVLFSGESFTQCPITTDHAVLKNLFKDVKNGMITDGTAIGMGLANAVNRLKDSEAKSKVVILLTDGENNRGEIPPLTAAEIARAFGVRVYTIGVGTRGEAPFPFRSPFGGIVYQNVEVKIDEPLLTQIADMTGGKYFRATDNKKLKAIYEEIDKLEKSKIQVQEFRKKNEMFLPWILVAGVLLFLEFILRNTVFRSVT